MKSWSVALAVFLLSTRAAAQPQQQRPSPWFDHHVSLSGGFGLGGGSADTARGDVPVRASGIWAALSYDYQLTRRFALGLSPRAGRYTEGREGIALLDLNAIGRLRFPADFKTPGGVYVGLAAGPTKSFLATPTKEGRAFTGHARPGWGFNLGITGGMEVLARSGWGICFELALVSHVFTGYWTYDVKSDGSRLEEDRRYATYEFIGTVGLLRGL